jgi:hypothetical protein
MWQQHKSVLDVARLNLWPAGHHKLGVIWAKGVNWNKGEIDRHIAAGKYSAAQCLSRLTDGMPNHTGAPNGPKRPTLATKWLRSVHKPLCLTAEEHAEEIKQHVTQLREHVALQVALQLGLCDEHGRATMMAATGHGQKRVARTATYGASGSVTSASRAAPAEAADAAERRQILAEAAEQRAHLQQASSSVSGAAARKRPAPASPPIAELAAAPAARPAAAPRKKPRPEDVIDLDSD